MSRMLKTYGEGEVVTSLREARQVNVNKTGVEGLFSVRYQGEESKLYAEDDTIEGSEDTLQMVGDILDGDIDYSQRVTENVEKKYGFESAEDKMAKARQESMEEYDELFDEESNKERLVGPAGRMS